jgi:hypothetical protein
MRNGRIHWNANLTLPLEAIANVFQLAVKRDPEIASFNPLALWNTYYVRTIAAI